MGRKTLACESLRGMLLRRLSARERGAKLECAPRNQRRCGREGC